MILVSLIAIMLFFCTAQDLLKVVKIFIKGTCVCLYGIGLPIYFCEVFQSFAFPPCHNIWMNKFFKIIIILWASIVKLIY